MKLSSAITAVLNVLGGGPGGNGPLKAAKKWLQNRFFNRHHIDPGTPSDTFGGKAIPQNFIAPSNLGVAKPTIIHTNLNLDGHSLAQDIFLRKLPDSWRSIWCLRFRERCLAL